MPLNLFTPRRLGAVGAAALVAVSTLAVGAFAQTGDVDPGQASAAAVPPEASPSEDFFGSSPGDTDGDREADLEQRRSEAEQTVDQGVRSAGGEGEAVHEPAPEPEEPSTTESPEPTAPSGGDTASAPDGSAQEIALEMVLDEGWDADEFHNCLEPLWEKESNWNHTAENSSSGAYGIPQSLPGDKMASHGDDWRTNPATQISWGLSYIKDRYGSPCEAWSHSQANNWY